MTYSKIIVTESMKITLLTLALFSLFDLLIKGYSNYHNWIIAFYVITLSTYYIIVKRYL